MKKTKKYYEIMKQFESLVEEKDIAEELKKDIIKIIKSHEIKKEKENE